MRPKRGRWDVMLNESVLILAQNFNPKSNPVMNGGQSYVTGTSLISVVCQLHENSYVAMTR